MWRMGLAAGLCLALGGCVGLAVMGAKSAATEAEIASDQGAAERGDAAAQLRLGEDYCCAIGAVDPVHDNRKATEWLCRAADQGNAKAALWLGRIYAGRPPVGFDPQQQAQLLVAGARANYPVAAAWLTRAAQGGETAAQKPLQTVDGKLTASDQAQVAAYLSGRESLPCRWDRVFPRRA